MAKRKHVSSHDENDPSIPVKHQQETFFTYSTAYSGQGRDLRHLRGMKNRALRNSQFRNADLSGVDFSGANLEGADLSGAKLRGTKFIGSNLHSVNLQDADLEGADLSKSRSFFVNGKGATFRDAKLHRTEFLHSDFDGADFSSSAFRWSKVGGSNLTPEQLKYISGVSREEKRHLLARGAKMDGAVVSKGEAHPSLSDNVASAKKKKRPSVLSRKYRQIAKAVATKRAKARPKAQSRRKPKLKSSPTGAPTVKVITKGR